MLSTEVLGLRSGRLWRVLSLQYLRGPKVALIWSWLLDLWVMRRLLWSLQYLHLPLWLLRRRCLAQRAYSKHVSQALALAIHVRDWRRRRRSRLRSQGSFHLLQTHHLACRGALLRRMLLLYGSPCCRLAPDGCIRLELWDVAGLLVRLITSPGGLGSLRLLHGLPCMMQHLLFQQRVSDLRRLSGEIEVPANVLARDGLATAEGVVVEGVTRLVKLLAQTVVGVVEVQHLVIVVTTSAQSSEWVVRLEHASGA